MLSLDCGLEFDSAHDDDFFAALPPFPAVCLISPRSENAEPFLIRTADLRRRLQRLLEPPDPTSKRLNLRELAASIRYRTTSSAFEQTLTYYEHAKQIFPAKYKAMLRLRPPIVLKINLKNAYPRCFVTRRISVDASGAPVAGVYYGPFASRKSAELFSSQILDLFKVRRCQIKIRRDPSFPGCIYSEMKMCLAPCFAGCTKEEYGVEVDRLVQLLETNGTSLRAFYEREREEASESLDFEKAGIFHKKIDKLDDVLRGHPELLRRVQDLNGLILQRASGEETIAVFEFRAGRLCAPFMISFRQQMEGTRSAESLLREHLENSGETLVSGDLSEHLWMIARWFYSNPREGEIFFREKDWPYRRIMRGCSRILKAREENS